jgi:hypothetical protein
MWSCEYLNVSGQQKSKLLVLENIRFFKHRQELKHLDKALHHASTVSIKFVSQKPDTANDTITQHRSKDTLLCPVKIWVETVTRKRSYRDSNNSTQVNTYHSEGYTIKITGRMLLN